MKKLLLIIIVLPLLMSSCIREPYSDFYVSTNVAEVYEIIEFYNTSTNYDNVEWDFGDGDYSTNPNPTHHYSYPGTYKVTLLAYGHGRTVDESSIFIDIYNQTILEVTVLEYWNGYAVQDASVILYPSMFDWINETNPILDNSDHVLEGITNSYGEVSFTGLNPVSYWLDVWHEHYNNYALGDEDENFVKTLPLYAHTTNTFTAYVDLIDSKSKKEGRELSQFRIVKIERNYNNKIENK